MQCVNGLCAKKPYVFQRVVFVTFTYQPKASVCCEKAPREDFLIGCDFVGGLQMMDGII